MAVAGLATEEVADWIAPYRGRVSLAGLNGPRSAIFSGDPDAIEDVLARLTGKDIFSRRINVDIASHSAQMDAIRPEFESCLGWIQPGCPRIPF